MILPPFRYVRPNTLDEAVTTLATTPGSAVLAGGQTLINMLKLDLAAPSALVDVHSLAELTGISTTEEGGLVIGAATVYAAIAASPEVRRVQPSVAAMAAGLVDRQVRNRGTIGGNCCLNDPTNNFPPLLVALEAEFHIAGPDGPRVLPADEFFVGTLATALRRGEILSAIEIPALPTGSQVAHEHLQVGADSWAIARSVVRLDVVEGEVARAQVVLGAVFGSPLRLPNVEEYLVGRPLDTSLATEASALVAQAEFETAEDVHCTATYRREMAQIQVRRALRVAIDGSRR